jgi:hypothetical protein
MRDQQTGRMSRSNFGSMRRESTAQMAVNIGREARELRAALAACRGDGVAEAKVMAALLAHLLVSSRELLQNLLMDTARQPRRIEALYPGGSRPYPIISRAPAQPSSPQAAASGQSPR